MVTRCAHIYIACTVLVLASISAVAIAWATMLAVATNSIAGIIY